MHVFTCIHAYCTIIACYHTYAYTNNYIATIKQLIITKTFVLYCKHVKYCILAQLNQLQRGDNADEAWPHSLGLCQVHQFTRLYVTVLDKLLANELHV